MAHINLLPWREKQRKQQQQEFVFMMVGGAVIAALLVLLVHLRLGAVIDHQEQRNAYLQAEIAELDRKIAKIKDLEATKARLLARMNIIQELQRHRPLSVHLVDELVRTLPEGAYLTEVEQRGPDLTISGIAQSNARVSAYMRNIDGSEWLFNPVLDFIETQELEGQRVSEFTLHAAQKIQEQDEDGAAAGAAGGKRP